MTQHIDPKVHIAAYLIVQGVPPRLTSYGAGVIEKNIQNKKVATVCITALQVITIAAFPNLGLSAFLLGVHSYSRLHGSQEEKVVKRREQFFRAIGWVTTLATTGAVLHSLLKK